MTSYYTIQPPPELRPFVRFFWVFEHEVTPGTTYIYRGMADACAEMIFHYKGVFTDLDDDMGSQSLSILQAPSKQHRRYTTNDSFGIFGAYLYPFAISQLFGISPSGMSDQVAVKDIPGGAQGRDLEEQIMTAASTVQRVEILSSFLEKKLVAGKLKDQAIHQAIRYMIHSPEQKTVEVLAQQFNLSARQFERKIKEHAGFSPKLFSRIIRFQSALKQYGNTQKQLTDIAHQCGYYDQSHFIHDFRKFSGYHPKQYFLHHPEGIEWREV